MAIGLELRRRCCARSRRTSSACRGSSRICPAVNCSGVATVSWTRSAGSRRSPSSSVTERFLAAALHELLETGAIPTLIELSAKETCLLMRRTTVSAWFGQGVMGPRSLSSPS